MPQPQTLRRVQSIREAEERQLRAQMELALADLQRLQDALKLALERMKLARALVASSVASGEQIDRIAALEETTTVERRMKILPARIAEAETEVVSIRQEFLSKRIERRQVECLLDEARAREATEINRKSQSMLDAWHLLQRPRKT